MLTLVIALLAQAAITKAPSKPALAIVTRSRNEWQLEYRLNRKSGAWLFPVSQPVSATQKPWRERAWRVVTPGARIERHGSYDVLVPTNGTFVPLRVRIAFTPTNATLDREYDPAIVFSNGATALYSDQFDVVQRRSERDRR